MTNFSLYCAMSDNLIINEKDCPPNFSGRDVHNGIVTSIPISIWMTQDSVSFRHGKPYGDSGYGALHTRLGLFGWMT